MLSIGGTEKRRTELLNLFELANGEPDKSQKMIEEKVSEPYTRSLSSNLSKKDIMNATDCHLQKYYTEFLYKIWNYANQFFE